jgi:hypothetical protein
MEDKFAQGFAGARQRVLLLYFIFAVGGLGGAADCYYLSHVGAPGAIATYGFAVFFGIIFVTFPVLSYVLTQYLKRNPNAALCPICKKELWWNTIVCFQTAVIRRCPNCYKSLVAYRGVPLDSTSQASATPNTEDELRQG